MIDPTDEIPEPRKSFADRWLGRLAFSFLIIAFYLAWQGMHVREQLGALSPGVRQAIDLIGAAAAAAMGALGIRARHRGRD